MTVGRNDPCPCGSGKKFKKCCERSEAPPTNRRGPVSVAPLLQAARQHQQAGRLRQAEATYREILRAQPNNADALHLLGLLAQQAGKTDIALDLLERCVTANPNIPAFQNNLANALYAQGKLDRAITHYQRALALEPGYAEAHSNIGIVLYAQGKLDRAITHYQRALALQPDYAEAHSNLGNAFRDSGQHDLALTHYQRALALQPNFAEAEINLGVLFSAQGKTEEAITHYQRALALQPNYVEAHNNLGNMFSAQGNNDWARAHFERALALQPNYAVAHSNMLLCLNYIPGCDPATIYARHLQFARQCAEPLAQFIQPHPNDRSPGRRLKIGYVSSDFRQHSVAHFIEPVLQSHDHDRFQVFCYSNHGKEGEVTRRIQSLADVWRNITGWSDEMIVQKIREDRIDVLVDLGGHTAVNRLLIFARKPAPVQATWLGYPNTTGLSTMDYRITDTFADPVGMTERFHSEQLVRLPECFSCYRPPRECPEVAELPSRTKGHVTFGSFNTFSKVTPAMMALWAEILKAVPDSRLTLKYNGLGDSSLQQRVRAAFAEHGVESGRLDLLGYSESLREHLEHYHNIDIGLDTFPYNGTTTTCDALWMGVPVVTLAGQTHVSRVGVSQMSNLRLTELIAHSPEEYIAIAVRLAMDKKRLEMLRLGLRSRMADSALTNAPRLTSNLEQSYRVMWEKWCDRKLAG